MNVNDTERIQHILDTAYKVLSFVKDRDKNRLYTDDMFSMSVLYGLLIIGEAASGISNEFKEKYPSVLWRKIISMRNRLIHGYFNIDLDIVWDTVEHDIPMLIEQLNKLSGGET